LQYRSGKKKSEPELKHEIPKKVAAVSSSEPVNNLVSTTGIPSAAQPVAKEVKTRLNTGIPSVSIKDALKGIAPKPDATISKPETFQVSDSEVIYKISDTNAFSQEQLNVAWEKFALLYKDEEPRMYSTLTAQSPVLLENFQVSLVLNNPLQEEEVSKLKVVLVNFLAKELSNGKIELKTTVTDDAQGNKRFYTDREKFDHLAEKNPSLIKFKQQFGLDFG